MKKILVWVLIVLCIWLNVAAVSIIDRELVWAFLMLIWGTGIGMTVIDEAVNNAKK